MGRDLAIADHRLVAAGFNPRARVGRDLGGGDGLIVNARVSIHAPAWGATRDVSRSGHIMLVFQSTRPRGARLDSSFNRSTSVEVSIHAPAWGATIPMHTSRVERVVSIHAPAWGATLAHSTGHTETPCFNPRARVGRDLPGMG